MIFCSPIVAPEPAELDVFIVKITPGFEAVISIFAAAAAPPACTPHAARPPRSAGTAESVWTPSAPPRCSHWRRGGAARPCGHARATAPRNLDACKTLAQQKVS